MSRPPSRGCVGKFTRLQRLFVYYSDVGRSTMIYGKIVGWTSNHRRVRLLVVYGIIGYCEGVTYWAIGVKDRSIAQPRVILRTVLEYRGIGVLWHVRDHITGHVEKVTHVYQGDHTRWSHQRCEPHKLTLPPLSIITALSSTATYKRHLSNHISLSFLFFYQVLNNSNASHDHRVSPSTCESFHETHHHQPHSIKLHSFEEMFESHCLWTRRTKTDAHPITLSESDSIKHWWAIAPLSRTQCMPTIL